jgi:glycine/D-amino acid oxidase-like deaminating enzyme
MAASRRETLAGAAALLAPGAAEARGKRGAGAFDVAVVGAGVFGSWTAYALARRGRRVALIDAYGIGHARASSGGETRVIRISYGGDPLYSEMALSSLAHWRRISQRADAPIFHRAGVLWFSPANESYMEKSLAWLQARAIPHSRMNSAALGAAYPQMRFSPGEAGFLERETGALVAGRGVQTVARSSGAVFMRRSLGRPVRRADGLYALGDDVTAGSVVYACGPWLPMIFPEELRGRIVATRQEVLHFGTPAGSTRYSMPELPVWADFNAGEIVYGIPDIEGQGFKMAFDAHGPEIDPDTEERTVPPETIARARSYLAQRFPELASAPLVHSRVCQYENSSNGDFLIDRLPGEERVWLVGGGSGHGFKHGPAVGERIARHVLDPAFAVEPRFALASKATVARRTVY